MAEIPEMLAEPGRSGMSSTQWNEVTLHDPGENRAARYAGSFAKFDSPCSVWIWAVEQSVASGRGQPMTKCRICGGTMRVTHRDTILSRHSVAYHLCTNCEYWCTDEPFWLEESYERAIAATDTGLVQRNLTVARLLRSALPRLFPTGPYVDWAGGHGMLVRLLRDAGFEFYWQDRYAENLLAPGFEWEANRDGRNATVVTAVEVLEHTPDPLGFLNECMTGSGAEAVIFTQVLHAGGDDPNWWYLAPVTGQHVSFFSAKTLTRIGEILGMQVQTSNSLHVISRSGVPAGRLRWALRVSKLPSVLWERRNAASLTWADHLTMTKRLTATRERNDRVS